MEKIKIGIAGLNFGECIINDILHGEAAPYFSIAGVCDLNAEPYGIHFAHLWAKSL